MLKNHKNKRLLAELKAHKFYPTEDACHVWFSIINDEIFDNKLSPVSFSIYGLKGIWGYYDSGVVSLNVQYPSKNLFLNILAHELIHAYQDQQGLSINHGKSFWGWRKKFFRNGLSLAIRYDGKMVVG